MHVIDQKYCALKEKIKLALIGLGMGGANIIPGVSGGTIAFMFGIYEDLITAIRTMNLSFLIYMFKGQFKTALTVVPWRFLGALLLGILLAIFSLAKMMSWLLVNQQILTFAFFFGLILATAPLIGKQIKVWSRPLVILGVLATVAMYWFVGQVPINTPDAYWFLFLCGAIAICTMILPGISGSFVLVLLGKYQVIIEAVSQREIAPLMVVAFGCVFGILAFVRFLSWVLSKYHDQTMMILTGLVIGSLRKIWPWKETLRMMTTPKGKVIPLEQINIIPAWSQEVLLAILIFVAGFALAVFLSDSKTSKN